MAKKPIQLWKNSGAIAGTSLADHQATLFSVLSGAIRLRTPPAPLIRALAEESPSGYGSTLRQLADTMEDDVPLIQALDQVPDALSSDMVLALRLGHQNGILDQAMETWRQEENRGLFRNRNNTWIGELAYWLLVAVAVLILVTYFAIRVLPQFQKLWFETSTSEAAYAEVFGPVDSLFQILPYLWVGLLALLGVLATTGWSAQIRKWLESLWKSWVPSKANTNLSLLRMLALCIDGGRPIVSALSTIAKYHPTASVRSQFLFARNEIEHGQVAWDALCDASVITKPVAECLSNESPRSQAWLLRKLAEVGMARREFSFQVFWVLMRPLVILGLGWIVLLLGSSVFRFLTGLVHSSIL